MALGRHLLTAIRAFILLVILLFSSASRTDAYGFRQFQTLVSLAHSLMRRVANLRASRGDVAGAARARRIAEKLEGGWAFWRSAWSVGWDYARNYAWRASVFRSPEFLPAVAELEEVLRALGRLARAESEGERARWVASNYARLLSVSKSLVRRLSSVFVQSGPLHETILVLQREVVEGELVADCVELGAADLKGLLQVAHDLVLQFFSPSSARSDL
ncbi:hypothetical protein EJ110_NYTH07363 [Nymphaea thermarum]|nr:hypothetical protein EJ110_NYTH07363 [Nymphaea thermarum]